MSEEFKNKAIKQLNYWGDEAKAAWDSYASTANEAAHARYERVNERACGYMLAIDAMGYVVVFDYDAYHVTDIVAK